MTTEATMQAERNAQEQRRAQLSNMEDKEEKVDEIERDETKWKDKYRRRLKAFTGSIRDPKNTNEYLEMLELQFNDLGQAYEFLQETHTSLIKLKTHLGQDVEDVTRAKKEKIEELNRMTRIYFESQQEVLGAMRQIRRETQEAEFRREHLEHEAQITREREAQAQARQNLGNAQQEHPNPRHDIRNPMGNLKKVDLPKFDGKLKDYFRWKSTFDVLVKNKEELDKNSKFLYLEQALIGEAHKIMDHLDHSPESYDLAITALEKKYGGAERQIQGMYNHIKEIKFVKDFYSLQDFQYALLGVQSMMQSQKLNKEDKVIHMQLCEKFHHRYMKDYLHYLDRTGKERKLESLIEFVEKELEVSQAAFEATSGKVKSSTDGGTSKDNFADEGRFKKRTVNSINKSKGENSSISRKCADCGENHPVWGCYKFQKKSLEDRLQIVKNKGLCFNCLGKGHSKADCYFKGKCDLQGCTGGHHKLLHQDRSARVGVVKSSFGRNENHVTGGHRGDHYSAGSPEKTSKPMEDEKKTEQANDATKHLNAVSSTTSGITLRTALNLIPIYVFKNNGQKRIRCLALHDSGSNTTLISESLKRKLGLHGRKETHIYHQPMRNDTVKREVEVIDMVKIESLGGDFSLKMKNVETMPGQLQAEAVDWNQYKEGFEYLRNVEFPEVNPYEKADILIGADQSLLFQKLDQRVPKKNGDPIAIETPLGWMCMGIIPNYRTVKQINALTLEEERFVYHNVKQDEKEVGEILRKFWEVDQFQHAQEEMSLENREVLQRTRENTKYDGMRYEVAMPFNERKLEQPSKEFTEEMWNMARKRLESTEAALKSKEGRKEKYQDVLDGYIEKGYARIALDPEETRWLLPHFPVIREDKETSKLRIVFDGSARIKNISLNDQIHEGPKLQKDIFEVLLRFRRFKVALNSDIKEMFPGIAVTPSDSQYLRILWRKMEHQKPEVIELLRVTFGINASPFLAMCTLLDHAEKYQKTFPRAVEALTKSTYVDDTLDSVKTVEEALKVYQQMTKICKEAGWKIHKWSSNSEELLGHIPEEDQVQGKPLNDGVAEGISVKILGVKWLPETDEFVGEATSVDMNGKKISKRIVLQKIAQIYDPLGMMNPFVMQCKMILQEVWMLGKDWDDMIDGQLRKKILDWFCELQYADSIRQPRALLLDTDEIQQAELHCFTDASERAYGTVIYLKLMYEDRVDVKWVAAKGRVCPLEPISIPRLELMAATLGAQMVDKVRNALEDDRILIRMWTDSMTTLWWITGRTRNLKMFVGNRVLEIHKYTDPSQWRHVPGEHNPADLISRGCGLQELKDSDLWKNGPEFLKKDITHWPSQTRNRTREADKEIKKQHLEHFVAQIGRSLDEIDKSDSSDEGESQSSSEEDSSDDSDMLIQIKRQYHMRTIQNPERECVQRVVLNNIKQLKVDPDVEYLTPTRFSSINKLVRVRAYVKRFVHNTTESPDKHIMGGLKSWELEEAEKEIIVDEQKRNFKTEYKALLKAKALDQSSKLRELNPQLDQDGMMRVAGRIREHPHMPWAMQCPIILPKQSHVTDLLIRREHEQNHMMGTNYLMGRLKEKYWIQSARSQIKSVTSKCMRCKLLRYQVSNQQMGLLPATRTQMNLRAFVNVGVDMAGPMMVKMGRGKPQLKRWICLFTCLSTRALHLELCTGLDIDSFMNALTRFIGRRGIPTTMLSDNGTNFRGADNEMRRLFDLFQTQRFQEKCHQRRIEWKFNPPGGPHHGGVYEAMIKATKTALKDVLFKRDLTDEELQTALVSTEGMLNQRPLSYVAADQEEVVLTPNHFLHGSLGGMLAPEVIDRTPTFQKKWRLVQALLNEIWSRWLREWVTELNKRKKWHAQDENLQVGDIVMVIEEDISKSRGDFPLARVTEVHTGPDGLVRSCKVKTADGRTHTRIIQKLAKIESTNDS